MILQKDEARKYGRKGQRASVAGKQHCIEGEYLTTREIAERIGMSYRAAAQRLADARKSEGAVTWERLGLVRE